MQKKKKQGGGSFVCQLRQSLWFSTITVDVDHCKSQLSMIINKLLFPVKSLEDNDIGCGWK